MMCITIKPQQAESQNEIVNRNSKPQQKHRLRKVSKNITGGGGGGGGRLSQFHVTQPLALVLPWYTQDIC